MRGGGRPRGSSRKHFPETSDASRGWRGSGAKDPWVRPPVAVPADWSEPLEVISGLSRHPVPSVGNITAAAVVREAPGAAPGCGVAGRRPTGRFRRTVRTNGRRNRLCSGPTHHGKTEMPQELDEVEGPDELIEGDLDELADDDDLIAEDGLAIADDDDAEIVAVEVDDEVAVVPEPGTKAGQGRRRRRGLGRGGRGGARRRGRRGQPGHHPEGAAGRRGARGRRGHARTRGPHGRRGGAGASQAARRVRLPVLLSGQAPQPAGGPEEDALPRLRVTRTDHG